LFLHVKRPGQTATTVRSPFGPTPLCDGEFVFCYAAPSRYLPFSVWRLCAFGDAPPKWLKSRPFAIPTSGCGPIMNPDMQLKSCVGCPGSGCPTRRSVTASAKELVVVACRPWSNHVPSPLSVAQLHLAELPGETRAMDRQVALAGARIARRPKLLCHRCSATGGGLFGIDNVNTTYSQWLAILAVSILLEYH
jgi:hypothetical protein